MTIKCCYMLSNTETNEEVLMQMKATKGMVRKRQKKKVNHDFRHWSFNETNELMDIWSAIDLDVFETKKMSYNEIQRQLKSRGFERTSEQIRCKLKRMTTTYAPKPPKPPSVTSESVVRQSEEEFNTEATNEDRESEDIIEYDIRLTDIESDSEDSLFGSTLHSAVKPIPPKNDFRPKYCDIFEERKEKLFEDIKDTENVAQECMHEIISGQQQLKESINQFNEEISRLTERILNDSSYESSSGQHSTGESSNRRSIKLILPDITKKYTIDYHQ